MLLSGIGGHCTILAIIPDRTAQALLLLVTGHVEAFAVTLFLFRRILQHTVVGG